VVISGHVAAVERACEIAKGRGAKRALMLPVSAPFHCALMAPAADAMAEALSHVDLETPMVPLVGNVNARAESSAMVIRNNLVDQITGRVRWRESVMWMAEHGVTETYEIGAGKALSGMVKRIDRALETASVGTPEEVAKAAAAING
jgi:[acyl-carrier-protein] S-malonyltransferase